MPTASREAIKAGEAVVELSLDDRKFNASLAGMKARFRQVASSMRQLVSISTGITVAMIPVVSAFVRFDDAMLAVRAVSGATAKELELLKSKAKELGDNAGYTASETARLMVELSKSGFKGEGLEQATSAILDLARATETELTVATQTFLDTYKQFQLSIGDTRRLVDLLTVAANSSSIGVTDLGIALSYAGPIAKKFGVSLEDTLALTEMLGEMGIRGEMAGTTLRRMFSEVIARGADVKRIFGSNIEVADAAGNPRRLIDIMGEIGDATRGLTEQVRLEKFKEFFQILGITGATILADRTTDIRKFRAELDNLNDDAAQTAKMMNSGLGGSLRRIGSELEKTAIAISEALLPTLVLLGEGVKAITDFVKQWIANNEVLAVSIGAIIGLLVALGAVGVGLIAIGLGLVAVAAPFVVFWRTLKLVVAVFLLLKTTVGLVALGIANLALALVLFTDTGARIANEIVESFQRIGAILAEMFGGIVAAFKKGDLQLAWNIALAGMYAAWLEFVILLRGQWNDFANYFRDIFFNASTAIAKGMVALVGGIQTAVLSVIINLINQLNTVHAAIAELTGGKAATHIAFNATPQAQTLYAKRQEEQLRHAAEATKRNKLSNQMAGLAVGSPEYNAASEAARASDEVLAVIEAHLKAIDAEIKKQEEAFAAGDKFISPERFQNKRDAIEKEISEWLKELDRMNAEERQARLAGQKDRLDAIRRERDEVLKQMRKLIEDANRVAEEAINKAGLPFGVPLEQTPMLPPMQQQQNLFGQYGDSARGLYQSADFKQALGIGGPNKAAQDAYQELKNIHGTLRKIEEKVGPMEHD